MQEKDAKKLLTKYYAGSCSEKERELVEYWFHHLNIENKLKLSDDELDLIHEEMAEAVYAGSYNARKKVSWPRLAAAACLLMFLSAAGVFFILHRPHVSQHIAQTVPHDVTPGSNKAMLTLANGQQIALIGARNGALAKQNNTVINKTADGQVAYQPGSAEAELTYNIMSTPYGGQYTLTLSDGTKVTLNAGSSLKYPVTFIGNERKVELSGEAYFEVAHNAAKPFRVVSRGQTIEVLGTHFNINSYQDEQVIKTTLLEGSVKVSVGNQSVRLKPGQQSQTTDLHIAIKEDADTEEAVAWKNGLFEFNNASLQQVMQNAARWYDLNVSYEPGAPEIKITGKISRQVNLSELIDLLRFERAKIKVEGKNIKILK